MLAETRQTKYFLIYKAAVGMDTTACLCIPLTQLRHVGECPSESPKLQMKHLHSLISEERNYLRHQGAL